MMKIVKTLICFLLLTASAWGTSYTFNATTSVVTVTTIAAIQTNIMSLACWVYRAGDGEGGSGRIMVKGTATTSGWWLYTNTTETYRLLSGRSTYGLWTVASPGNNIWTHLAVAYDDTNVNNDAVFFLNGVSASVTESQAPNGATSLVLNIIVGNASTENVTWDGKLGDCAYYNRMITANEAKQIMYFGPNSVRNGLVAFWPLGAFAGRNYTATASLNASGDTATAISNIGPPRVTPQGTGLLGW